MNSKLYVLGIVLVLLTLVISGCGTTTTEATTGLANPASVYCEEQGYTLETRTDADGGTYGVCTFPDGSECEEWAFYRGECKPASVSETAVDTPELELTVSPPTEEGPTQTPEPVSTQEVEDPYSGWASYVNPDYGFAFRYPTTWTLEEEANLVKLSQGTLLLAIAFQRQDENASPPWTGMPAGAFESRGEMAFLGQEIERNSLVFEGRVKVLTYGAEVGDVLYAIRLDDMTTADYQTIDISEAIQDEVDRIVGSFMVLDGGQTVQAEDVATSLPASCLNSTEHSTLFVNPVDDYCLRYPPRFQIGDVYPSGIANLYGPPYDCSPEPMRAAATLRVERPAPDLALADIVNDWLAYHNVHQLTQRDDGYLGGEPAMIIEGQGEWSDVRIIFALHEGNLYALSFYPFDERFPQAAADVEDLWQMVVDTFAFLPPETRVSQGGITESRTDLSAKSPSSPTGTPPRPHPSFEFTTYRDESAGFEFDYPLSWTLNDKEERGARGYVVQLTSQPTDQSQLDVAVVSWEPNDLDGYAAVREQDWLASGMTILSRQEYLLDGDRNHKAFCYMVQGQSERALYLITSVGERYLTLSGTGDLDVLIEIALTVRRLAPSP